MAGITINPALVTNAPGQFSISTYGYMQGMALDDPATNNELCAGIVLPTASTPMWGGMAITELTTSTGTESGALKNVVQLATSQANVTGFTVFNQAHAMINTPQSPVPLAPPSGGINYYRLGSGARIPVACTAAVAAAFEGVSILTAAYWDYTNQVLLSAPGGTALAVKVVDVAPSNSLTVSYASGTGFATWKNATYPAIVVIQI